jgi:hypothetical protein
MKLYDNVKIIRYENMKNELINFGFNDFNIHMNKKINNINYNDILTEEIKELIYKYYQKDFEIFKYEK